MNELYIYKKEIDWSTLNLGINIPISLQDVFYDNLNIRLKKGENKNIRLIIDGNEYSAILTNINFDERKYPGHKDLLQIRYSPNSAVSSELKSIFSASYNYLFTEKQKLQNKKKQLTVPENIREYLAIYSTPVDTIFSIDCITNRDIQETKSYFLGENEIDVENIISSVDNSSSIVTRQKSIKIRKLDKTISDNLKRIYNSHCQICGEFIGQKYNTTIIHSHHIEYFSISLNNNADNIMIVCPNHHAIIHATNPTFDRKNKTYNYPNGYKESLVLNIHL
jgi:5-methylcytosine-specific restriction endonuclease McrA